MNIRFNKADLQSAISGVKYGYKKESSPIPVLSYVLVGASSDSVRLKTTNLEVGISAKVQNAIADQPGSVLLPGKKFFEIIDELSDRIDLASAEKNVALIKSGKSSYKLYGMDPDTLPVIPEKYVGDEDPITMPAKAWLDGINGTAYACYKGQDGIGNSPASVLVEVLDGTMCFVATDGHRLALVQQEHPHKNTSVTLHHDGIRPLSALLRGDKPEVLVSVAETDNKTFVWPENQEWCLSIQKSTARFPNYKFALDDNLAEAGRVEFIVGRLDLIDSINLASLYHDEIGDSKAIALSANIQAGKLEVTGRNSEGEEAFSEKDCEIKHQGSQPQYLQHLNYKYLLEFLKSFPAEKVRVIFRGENLAVEIRPEPEQNPRYRYVVMTIRR